jgi:hypothetical protein
MKNLILLSILIGVNSNASFLFDKKETPPEKQPYLSCYEGTHIMFEGRVLDYTFFNADNKIRFTEAEGTQRSHEITNPHCDIRLPGKIVE